MSKNKNRYYGIEAKAVSRGFVGEFRAPGLTPDVVKSDDGPVVFGSEADAVAAGARVLMNLLNAPRARANAQGRRDFYRRMSGAEFAEKLKETGMTLTLFANTIGTSEKRVLQWIDGRNEKGDEELPPHHVRVLLEIFIRMPKTIDIAEDLAHEFSTAVSPRVHAPFTADQVEALRQHQADESRHPLTCPNNEGHCSDADRVLIPTAEGLVCGCGAYRQTWIYEKMTIPTESKKG